MKEYQKKAQNTYNSRFDMTTLRLPKGTKDRIRQSMGNDVNISQFCINSILAELDRMENKSTQEPINIDKYNDMPTLAPMPKPQPVMSAEDEVKSLQELQKRIDERKGNTSRINEKPSESVSEDTGEEMDTKDDKTAQNGNMDSVGDILDGFMNPPKTDFLSKKEKEINDRLKQKAIDDEQFEPLTEEKIEATIKTYGMDLVDNSELVEQIIESHGRTNYDRIVATMKHKRMIRTD